MGRLPIALGLVLLAAGRGGAGEAPAPPEFTNLRYDEDWSDYAPDDGGTWLAPLKRIAISEKVWLSFGGDARLRWEYLNGANFDRANEDGYLLYRSFQHADLHLGPHWRVFAQGRFSGIGRRDLPGGNREALDYDKGDLWNAFVEAKYPLGGLTGTLRAGRIELQYGKQRLVSPLDWSNNRRIFEGAVLQLAGPDAHWELDAFLTRPVVIDGDRFTWNEGDKDRAFAGLYYTRKLGEPGRHAIDAYLFYQQRAAPLVSREDLYTLGARVHGPIAAGLAYDVEAAGQFGRRVVDNRFFDDTLDIAAYFVSAELRYTFADTWGKPYLLLGLDYASGDGDPTDRRVETFNQLYPLGHAYFGYIDTVARQNIQAARLGGGITLVPQKVTAAADFHFFGRAAGADGLYSAGGALARGPAVTTPGGRVVAARHKTLGRELDLTLQYRISRHLTATAGYSRFFTGGFLGETGVSDNTDFVYAEMEMTF